MTRLFGKTLELLLVSALMLGAAYYGVSYLAGAIGDSLNDSAALIEGDAR